MHMGTLSDAQLLQYLQRINAPCQSLQQLMPDLRTLDELQFAHVRSIPFENLALHHPKAHSLSFLADSTNSKPDYSALLREVTLTYD